MARVVLEQVSKFFPESNGQVVRALSRVNLVVEDADYFALVGPSGCGKTSTLRLITGLEEPTEGGITLGGKSVAGVPPEARNVAMVFQHHALFPHLTAEENVAIGLKLRRVSKAEIARRVRDITGLLGLRGCLNRKPAELSGGERQRVALGRALVRRPQVLLLDEPLSNLDAPLRREMRRELLRLHHELSLTVIHVTHDQVEALALGRRVAVMRAGTIEQIGTPDELRRQPGTPFVAAFLDPSPL